MMTPALPTLNAIFLVAIRFGVVLIFTPVQIIRQLPIHIRLITVLGLSTLLAGNLTLSPQNTNEMTLIVGALVELSNGLILSLGLYAAFAVIQIAGQLIDT